jgi:hypothetical protein
MNKNIYSASSIRSVMHAKTGVNILCPFIPLTFFMSWKLEGKRGVVHHVWVAMHMYLFCTGHEVSSSCVSVIIDEVHPAQTGYLSTLVNRRFNDEARTWHMARFGWSSTDFDDVIGQKTNDARRTWRVSTSSARECGRFRVPQDLQIRLSIRSQISYCQWHQKWHGPVTVME